MLGIVAAGLLPFYQPEARDLTAALVQHLLFLQDYFGSEFMPAFWSLGVEEKFYLLCPFASWWLGRHPRRRQVWILAALALLPMLLRALALATQGVADGDYAAFFWTVRSPFHLALDGLSLGVLCALAWRWRPARLVGDAGAQQRLLAAGAVLVLLLLCSLAWLDAGHHRAAVVVLTLTPLGFAAIVLAVVLGPTRGSGWLRSRWLRFLAVVSYSVYLTHTAMVRWRRT